MCSYKKNNASIIKDEPRCLILTELDDDHTPIVKKMYYKRGLANYIREKIMRFRAEREYLILKHLVRCGISCSRPVYWTHGYCREYGFYETISTRNIPDTITLRSWLASQSKIKKHIDLDPLFKMVFNMHNCGVYHGALSTKNILINFAGHDEPSYHIVDLACGWLFSHSIFGKRIAWWDLLKLVKSIENRLGSGYCRPFLSGYGLRQGDLEKFYRDVDYYRSFSRKQKRVKNVLKVKVFFSAISAKFCLPGASDTNYYPNSNPKHE